MIVVAGMDHISANEYLPQVSAQIVNTFDVHDPENTAVQTLIGDVYGHLGAHGVWMLTMMLCRRTQRDLGLGSHARIIRAVAGPDISPQTVMATWVLAADLDDDLHGVIHLLGSPKTADLGACATAIVGILRLRTQLLARGMPSEEGQ